MDAALKMGARQIWMPTLDLAGPGGFRLDEPMVFDENAEIRDVVYEIVDRVREADVVLGTGHLPVPETVALVRLCRERGLHKILVTHPEAAFVQMSVATQQEISGEGVFFERCYNDVMPTEGTGIALGEIAAQIRQVGVNSTVLSSDYGQAGHPPPTEGFREYLAALQEAGMSWAELSRMAGENPAYLMGL